MAADYRIANLPLMIRSEFERMDEQAQFEFLSEYRRRQKSVGTAYFASLLSLHYAYLGRLWLTLLSWLVGILTFGVAMVIWWIVDLFRIPGMVANKNSDIAIEVLRDQKIIRG